MQESHRALAGENQRRPQSFLENFPWAVSGIPVDHSEGFCSEPSPKEFAADVRRQSGAPSPWGHLGAGEGPSLRRGRCPAMQPQALQKGMGRGTGISEDSNKAIFQMNPVIFPFWGHLTLWDWGSFSFFKAVLRNI